MNSSNNNIVVTKIKEWITPGLILIISFFVKGWMHDVDTKLDQITSLQTQVTNINSTVNTNSRDINDSRQDIKKLQDQMLVVLVGKKKMK